MYFRNRTKKFTEDCFSSENIQGLWLALEEADAVIIGAGAGGLCSLAMQPALPWEDL